MENKEIIFVTGCPRSGTTVVGDVLSMAIQCKSLYEPFSFYGGMKEVDRRYPMVGDGFTEKEFEQVVSNIEELNISFKNNYSPHSKWYRKVLKLLIGGRNKTTYLQAKLSSSKHLVLKDPNGIFMLHDFAKRKVKCVVCCRGVESVAASMKRMNWSPDILLHNSRLESRQLFSVGSELLSLADTTAKKGAIMWLLIYANVAVAESDPCVKVHCLNNQKLMHDCIDEYKLACDFLGFDITMDAERKIRKIYSFDENLPDVPSAEVHGARRNLAAVNSYYASVLNKEEIEFAEKVKAIFIAEFGNEKYLRYFSY